MADMSCHIGEKNHFPISFVYFWLRSFLMSHKSFSHGISSLITYATHFVL